MKTFRDVEHDIIIAESELHAEFTALQSESPEEYNYSFAEYVRNCTGKNGTLEEVN